MSGNVGTNATCQLNEHRFSTTMFEKCVHFYVLQLHESFLVWIGTVPHELTNLSVAINSKFEKNTASTTTLLGDMADLSANSIAQRLAKKTGKQVFVSCNLPAVGEFLPLVEARLMTELKNHPDKF
ncbi:proteasome assembly chaperone 4-like isoform X2 [Antedon mediterranea]